MVYARFIKPVADILMALVLIAIATPLLFLLLVFGSLAFGNPVFVQTRSGKGGRTFLLLKFRSMLPYKGQPEESRFTVYGRFIRRYSLDELPQLFNILAGQMSFVGPRPLPVEYRARMTNSQRTRFNVKPGLTGLVQVSGRNRLSWEEKFRYDAEYVENLSFQNDLRIVLRTLPACWNGDGISHPGYASMPVFEGESPSL